MQYPQVVNWVNKIVPDLRRGDPTAVLLEKASAWRDPYDDSEMPVAILEKAAQVFNQGMVLENMSQGRRGETQELIDIDQLVSRYVAPTQKAASAVVPRSPVLTTALPNFNFHVLSEPDLRKAASATEKPAAAPFEAVKEAAFRVEDCEQVLSDLKLTLHNKAAAWKRDLLAADLVYQGDGRHCEFPSFGRIEADAVRMEPWMAKAADWLATHWERDKVKVAMVRATDKDRGMHKLAHDYTGHAHRLVDIGRALADTIAAMEICEEAKAAAAVEESNKSKAKPKPPKTSGGGAPEEGGTGTPPKEEKPAPPKPGKAAPASGAVGAPPASAVQYLKLQPTGAETSGDKPDLGKGRPADGAKPGLVGQVLNMGGGAGAQLLQRVISQAEGLGGGKNVRQQKIDESVQGIQELHGLQKLMQTDSVISKADPQLVADIFATIRRGSPTIAADPALLRFQLREALQYGGIPTEGYNQLAKTRELDNDDRENTRRENQTKYGPKKTPA